MRTVVYVAHPLGDGHDREESRASAARWCAAIAEAGPYNPVAMWIVLSGEWDESKRELGLALDLELVSGCDEVWLVGPRVSPGMRVEAGHALVLGKVVRKLTGHTVDDVPRIVSTLGRDVNAYRVIAAYITDT